MGKFLLAQQKSLEKTHLLAGPRLQSGREFCLFLLSYQPVTCVHYAGCWPTLPQSSDRRTDVCQEDILLRKHEKCEKGECEAWSVRVVWRASRTAQQVTQLLSKPEDPSLIPGTHVVTGGSQLLQLVFQHSHIHCGMSLPTHINIIHIYTKLVNQNLT